MKQSIIEQFLGGKIRYAILDALAQATEPITAYRIARKRRLDPAATYRYIAEFEKAGIVESVSVGRQTAYRLTKGKGEAAIMFLKSLQGEEVDQLRRPLSVSDANRLLAMRTEGELDALAECAKINFQRTFKQIGTREYVLIEE